MQTPENSRMSLEPIDQRHLTAAQGYVELGMFLDANEELEKIDPFCRSLPEVLEVRIQVYQSLEKWELMQVVARKLAQYDEPNVQAWTAWAYATRRAEGIEEGMTILKDALGRHPDDASIHYSLACCQCQLGDPEAARIHLKLCFEINPGLRLHALDDDDLMPIWDSLSVTLEDSH